MPLRLAAIDQKVKAKMFSKEWGKQVLSQLGLDPSDAELANQLFTATWDATVVALDTVLTKLTVDTTKASASGMAWTYQAAGLAYFYTHQALMDLFGIASTLSPKVDQALAKLTEASAKYTKDAKKLAASADQIKAALKTAADAAAKKNASAMASKAEEPQLMAASTAKVARFHRYLDRVIARQRVALQEKKQDPSKTMMGQWSEADQAEAQKLVTGFKASAEKLDATIGPLVEYTKKFDPSKIKQLGHVVSFVSTVKPVVSKAATLLNEMTTSLKTIS